MSGSQVLRRAALVVVLAALPASGDVDAVRRSWEGLRERDAALLAPKRAEEAAAAVAALEAARAARSDASLQLAEAEKRLVVLEESVRTAEKLWHSLLQLRREARLAGAATLSPRPWREAENILSAAARKLEAGRTDAAKRQAESARVVYESARFEALRAGLLNAARSDLARAEKAKARQFTPRSYVRALDALEVADKLLTERKTFDDEVRAAAAAAQYEVAHLLFLLERVRGTCDNDGLERIEGEILEWEDAMRRASQPLRLNVSFEAGFQEPLRAIEAEITRLAVDRDRLRETSSRRSEASDSLVRDVRRLQHELRERDVRIAELEQAAGELETMARVQGRFTRDEGRVMFEDRDIILRLHGLRFPSGSADLPAEAGPLLEKVVETVSSIPGAVLVVEGHTDSQGRPETNQDLSIRRAAAVRDYVADRIGMAPERITTIGYGAVRPVASNDDETGRALNRRIEITIARP